MRRTAAVLALVCLLAAAPLSLAATSTVTESYTALLAQIDGGQVVVAHVNEATNDIRVTLKSGSEEFVRYKHADHRVLIDALIHHGVTPIYTKPKATTTHKAVHHVLRYVAAGVVVVLLLIGGGVWMYTRGQRQPPAPAPADGAEPQRAAEPPDAPIA